MLTYSSWERAWQQQQQQQHNQQQTLRLVTAATPAAAVLVDLGSEFWILVETA
jgi:hypothetical protein